MSLNSAGAMNVQLDFIAVRFEMLQKSWFSRLHLVYVLIRSAQTKHKTFINIKHNTSSSGEGLLPRSWFNENAYDWYKNKTRS